MSVSRTFTQRLQTKFTGASGNKKPVQPDFYSISFESTAATLSRSSSLHSTTSSSETSSNTSEVSVLSFDEDPEPLATTKALSQDQNSISVQDRVDEMALSILERVDAKVSDVGEWDI